MWLVGKVKEPCILCLPFILCSSDPHQSPERGPDFLNAFPTSPSLFLYLHIVLDSLLVSWSPLHMLLARVVFPRVPDPEQVS